MELPVDLLLKYVEICDRSRHHLTGPSCEARSARSPSPRAPIGALNSRGGSYCTCSSALPSFCAAVSLPQCEIHFLYNFVCTARSMKQISAQFQVPNELALLVYFENFNPLSYFFNCGHIMFIQNCEKIGL